MIDCREQSDALAQKTYDTESGRDPALIVWIPLTVWSEFGASLTFGSVVIVCQK